MPRGGWRPGSGRKVGSKQKITDSSIKKLRELDIDPINILVKELKRVEGREDQKSVLLRVRIAEKLLDYSYKKMPTAVETTDRSDVPLLAIGIKNEIKENNDVLSIDTDIEEIKPLEDKTDD